VRLSEVVWLQATCELVYAQGMSMALQCIQLSDVTRIVRHRVRQAYYTSAGTVRSDMAGAFFVRRATTTAEQLAIVAPARWPDLLDTSLPPLTHTPGFHAACALVQPSEVCPEGVAAATMPVPEALQGSYFGVEQRRSSTGQDAGADPSDAGLIPEVRRHCGLDQSIASTISMPPNMLNF
jgi:hypothetical protein